MVTVEHSLELFAGYLTGRLVSLVSLHNRLGAFVDRSPRLLLGSHLVVRIPSTTTNYRSPSPTTNYQDIYFSGHLVIFISLHDRLGASVDRSPRSIIVILVSLHDRIGASVDRSPRCISLHDRLGVSVLIARLVARLVLLIARLVYFDFTA